MLGKIGPVEIVIIVALVAILLRPKRLSEFARSLAQALREFRHNMQE